MEPVKLINFAHQNAHAELHYAANDARRSFWTGRFSLAGIVRVQMCPSCGRITLCGEHGPAS